MEYKVYGTKCVTMPYDYWRPPVLSNIWKQIVNDYGSESLNKPIPGMRYVKKKKAITSIDQPFFRRLPAEIQVLSPPRLFRSNGYKYNGRVYLECELYWEFNYRYKHNDKDWNDWMSVSLLSYCYEPKTSKLINDKKIIQLSLFD